MKTSLAAMLALGAAGAAHALSPAQIDADRANGTLKEVVLHGASELSNLVAGYAFSICNSDIDAYWNSGGSGTGKDYKAYACTLKATVAGSGGWKAGTPVLITKRDLGGAVYGVNPVALQWKENSMVVDSTGGNCVATGQQASVTQASYTCATTALVQAIAGLSTVEPAMINVTMTAGKAKVAVNLPSGADDGGNPWAVLSAKDLKALDSSTTSQVIYGVAVNLTLRNALQTAQGLIVGSETDADVPSIPAAFYSGLVTGYVKGITTGYVGWDALTGVAADNAKQVNLCRRVAGSGAQAGSNLLFAGAGAVPTTTAGALFPITSNGVGIAASGAPLAVVENATTGATITCIANAPSGAYVAGVLSLENDPGSSPWRFVRLDGQLPTQVNARHGAYPFLYSATMQWKKSGAGAPDAGTRAFLVAMRQSLGTPDGIAALASPLSRRGALASPGSYSGSCASQTAGSNAQLYGSCVERLDFGSPYNSGVLFYGLKSTAAYPSNSAQSLHIVK